MLAQITKAQNYTHLKLCLGYACVICFNFIKFVNKAKFRKTRQRKQSALNVNKSIKT